jgi:hypothetical protein
LPASRLSVVHGGVAACAGGAAQRAANATPNVVNVDRPAKAAF